VIPSVHDQGGADQALDFAGEPSTVRNDTRRHIWSVAIAGRWQDFIMFHLINPDEQ
jgi:hypothetical protein